MPSAFRAWKWLQMSPVTRASVRSVFKFCEILVLKYFRGSTMLYICTFSQASIYLNLLSSLPVLSVYFKKITVHQVLVIANVYKFYMGFVIFIFIYSLFSHLWIGFLNLLLMSPVTCLFTPHCTV